MPATIIEDRMDTSSRDGEIGQNPSTSYQLYSTDEYGSLRVSCPPEEGRMLLVMPAKKKYAVHKMARGTLAGGTPVIALARHNGQIDVVNCQDGKLLAFYQPREMRESIHRWVGLAVAADGIYSCTSAGSFRFTPIEINLDQVTKGIGTHVDLPEPLQACEFEPAIDPKFFAFGGEEVPLSVWDIKKAISTPPAPESEEDDEGHGVGAEEGAETSSRATKRKRVAERRAKAKEYKWGETWRAKNLPNDALSLPQKPSIISIAFLEETKLAVGLKYGVLRLYEVGPQRKYKKEVKLFHPKPAAVKNLVCSHNEGELIAADTIGRVYVVNWRSGQMLYKYEIFSGAAVSLCSMPPSQGSKKGAHLATSSAEKLLRMHGMPINNDLLRRNKENGKITSTKFYEDGVYNLVWDGIVPQIDSADQDERDEEGGSPSDRIEEEEDIWQGMVAVDDEADETQHRSQRRRTTTQS